MPHLPSDPIRDTLAYYDEHAEAFVERTAHVSVAHLYEPFLTLIPQGGRILDAGCGSGRDAAEFLRRGYEVVAFDGSDKLARIASRRTGLDVFHLTFDEIPWRMEFDGIWACASLLHLPSEQLHGALDRLVEALRPGGALYVSFKAGNFEGTRAGRWFSDMTEAGLQELLSTIGRVKTLRVWISQDSRSHTIVEWVNGLAQMTSTSHGMVVSRVPPIGPRAEQASSDLRRAGRASRGSPDRREPE